MKGSMTSSASIASRIIDRAADVVDMALHVCWHFILFVAYAACWATVTGVLLLKQSIAAARNSKHCTWKRWKMPLTVAACIAFAFCMGLHIGYDKAFEGKTANELTAYSTGEGGSSNDAMNMLPANQRRTPRPILELMGEATKERRRAHSILREEYGSYYGSIFDKALIRRIFVSGEEARKRLTRRVMMKILSAQVSPDAYVRFTWATAGDSAAAGHGNRVGQSYTTVMEMTVRDAFSAVGVNFISRNHGMRDVLSTPELALCNEAVYGKDVDVLNWDFTVTEARDAHRIMLWAARAATHPEKPVLFMQDSPTASGRWDLVSGLEDIGVAPYLMDADATALLQEILPDLMDKTTSQDSIPPPLRHFVCDGSFEGVGICADAPPHFTCGKPSGIECQNERYNIDPNCEDDRYNAMWNPGWRMHLLKGRLLGVFLLDVLVDALVELDSLENPEHRSDKIGYGQGDYKSLLAFLQQKDSIDKFLFETAQVSVMDAWQGSGKLPEEVLAKGFSICRTALLPAQQRLDLEREGGSHFGKILATNNTLALAFSPSENHRCEGHAMDAKDFFFLPRGSSSVTRLPGNGEMDLYAPDKTIRRKMTEALIMLCFNICVEDNCRETSLGPESGISIAVDGRPVTGSVSFDGCHFMQGTDGLIWPTLQRNDPSFDLEMSLSDDTQGSLRVTSMSAIYPPIA